MKIEQNGVTINLDFDDDGFPLIGIELDGYKGENERPAVEVKLNDLLIHDMFDDEDTRWGDTGSTFYGNDHVDKVTLKKADDAVWACEKGQQDALLGEYEEDQSFVPSALLLRSRPVFQKWVDDFASSTDREWSAKKYPVRWTCPNCQHEQNDSVHVEHGPFISCTCEECGQTFHDEHLDPASLASWEKARTLAEKSQGLIE